MVASFIDRINQTRVPTYLVAGWYDTFTRDMVLLCANLAGPKRLVVRPLDRSQIHENQFDLDFAAEAHG